VREHVQILLTPPYSVIFVPFSTGSIFNVSTARGIGQHFHSQCEEMFVILNGEAQLTVDRRTSLIKGPAGVAV